MIQLHMQNISITRSRKSVRTSVKLDYDCVVYASGQPCPMCLAAMRMAGSHKYFYVYSNDDAPALWIIDSQYC